MNDIRLAFRQLTKNASFAAIAAFTLALGIGATTAIFAVLDSVALDPLPYPEPERQVWLESAVPGWRPGGTIGLSQAGYFYFSEHNRTLESLGAYVATDVSRAAGQSSRCWRAGSRHAGRHVSIRPKHCGPNEAVRTTFDL